MYTHIPRPHPSCSSRTRFYTDISDSYDNGRLRRQGPCLLQNKFIFCIVCVNEEARRKTMVHLCLKNIGGQVYVNSVILIPGLLRPRSMTRDVFPS